MAASTDDQNKLIIFTPFFFFKEKNSISLPLNLARGREKNWKRRSWNIGESDVFFAPGNSYYLQQYKQHTKRGNFYSLSPPSIIFYPFFLIKQSLPFRVTKLLQIIYNLSRVIRIRLWKYSVAVIHHTFWLRLINIRFSLYSIPLSLSKLLKRLD